MLRPAQNVNKDGGFELGWGTMILLAGLVPYFNAALPKALWNSSWISWVAYLPLICMAFAPYAVPLMIRKFITWPRTGYVANPNDVKFPHLLMIMVFGLALGWGISRLTAAVRDFMGLTGPHRLTGSLILNVLLLVVCTPLVVYWGRKVIRRRPPLLPTAYDAVLITQGLKQTATGRKQLRLIRLTMAVLFIGGPLLAGALVLWLMYLSNSAVRSTELRWPHLGMVSLMIATNLILYLMANAVALKRHRWKWLAVLIMLIGPIIVARTIPSPPAQPGMAPILDLFPPPVMLSIGLVWFLSGGITLVLFMRHNPLPPAEAQ